MNTKISFRPHHFLCAFCFQGSGYSAKFVRNFAAIMATLNDPHTDQTIHVTPATDDICSPCPHRHGHLCESETKVQHLDAQHSEAFGLIAGDILNWTHFKNSLPSLLTMDKFDQICKSCEWKSAGICESALRSAGVK